MLELPMLWHLILLNEAIPSFKRKTKSSSTVASKHKWVRSFVVQLIQTFRVENSNPPLLLYICI